MYGFISNDIIYKTDSCSIAANSISRLLKYANIVFSKF